MRLLSVSIDSVSWGTDLTIAPWDRSSVAQSGWLGPALHPHQLYLASTENGPAATSPRTPEAKRL